MSVCLTNVAADEYIGLSTAVLVINVWSRGRSSCRSMSSAARLWQSSTVPNELHLFLITITETLQSFSQNNKLRTLSDSRVNVSKLSEKWVLQKFQTHDGKLLGRLTSPFSTKQAISGTHSFGWKLSSARLRIANDKVTFWPRRLFVQQRPKMGNNRGGSFKLLR